MSGLAGTGLVLQLNGTTTVNISGNGAFTFPGGLPNGSSYSVGVLTNPTAPTQLCTVSSGTGTIASAAVTNVSVSCVNSFTVGGSVSGLQGTGLLLQYGGGSLAVGADGAFTLPGSLLNGAGYAVTVAAEPANPTQTCAAANGSGTIAGANVTNVAVSCTTSSFTLGGAVSGLTGAGLVLRNNCGTDLPIAAPGPFTFGSFLSGTTFGISVLTQPAGQTCVVTKGSGMIGGADVSDVAVACGVPGFSVATVADPLAPQQWHLRNTCQTGFADTGGVAGMDLDVDGAYGLFNLTGGGVIAAVVDSGLELAHEDLAANIVPGGSWNFNDGTTDPTNTLDIGGDHGTSVAGLIAMARNSFGGIGVAPGAQLKGFNLLSMFVPTERAFLDSLGASTSMPDSSDVFIFNQSFGVDTAEDIPLDSLHEAQYLAGVTSLRGGKGAVYVKAGGNGFQRFTSSITGQPANCAAAVATQSFVGGTFTGLSCQNVNFEPDSALPYQIVVAATNANGVRASYSSAGSAIWVSAPGGEFGRNAVLAPAQPPQVYAPAMVTTDQSGCSQGFANTIVNNDSSFDNGGAPNTACNYTNGMNGTSSATPVAVGAIALVLEANPALTWRDVKHILAATARQVDATRSAVTVALANGSYVAEPAWTVNHATPTPYRFHNWYGFGMIDATAAVTMAKSYTPGQLGTFANTGVRSSGRISVFIPDNNASGATSSINVPNNPAVQFIEAVQITVNAAHAATGDLGIELLSPMGTRSVLKNIRDGFGNSSGLSSMLLLSNAFYGEKPAGTWTIKVVDGGSLGTGSLTGWTIRIYGH